MKPSPVHRPELDGLRALAVVPVLLFHAGIPGFSGGYVGVDVFFVLSGYLITGQIADTLARGTWSLAQFYERRVRRILPALFVTAAVCIPWAMAWMVPIDQEQMLRSVGAVVGLFANVFFWQYSGYFEAVNEFKPLMHTWSLSIEEQFYIFFPLALVALLRAGHRTARWALVLVGLLSFALSVWASANRPGAGFYLLPARAWEFLVGALIALHSPRPTLAAASPGISRDGALSAAGLLLTLVPVIAFDNTTRFPGHAALLPVLGAVLLIRFAGPATAIHRLMCARPVVQIGLISYSLYLLHQPLLAFARHRVAGNLDIPTSLAVLAASFPLAYASWWWVERPVRARRSARAWQALATAAAGGLCLVALTAGLVWATAPGRPLAPRAELAALATKLAPNYGLSKACSSGQLDATICSTGPAPRVLVWGDSFAMHLMAGIVASKPRLAVQQATMSGCGPFLDIAPLVGNAASSGASRCIGHNAAVLDQVRRTPSVALVILASSYVQYLSEEALIALGDGRVVSGRDQAAAYLQLTIDSIRKSGRAVWVVAPPPSNGVDLGRCLAKSVLFGRSATVCDFDFAASGPAQRHIAEILRGIERAGTTVVWPEQVICQIGRCRASRDGVFIYRDGGHLSEEGSRLVGAQMWRDPALLWPLADRL